MWSIITSFIVLCMFILHIICFNVCSVKSIRNPIWKECCFTIALLSQSSVLVKWCKFVVLIFGMWWSNLAGFTDAVCISKKSHNIIVIKKNFVLVPCHWVQPIGFVRQLLSSVFDKHGTQTPNLRYPCALLTNTKCNAYLSWVINLSHLFSRWCC